MKCQSQFLTFAILFFPISFEQAQRVLQKQKSQQFLADFSSICTEGGTWTRTNITAHWILSPACLPIPPLLQVL